MAAEARKKGMSKLSWEEAAKDAAKDMAAGTYEVVAMQVVVVAESPGKVHEYVVELG
jgi:flavin-binding protein dodecin